MYLCLYMLIQKSNIMKNIIRIVILSPLHIIRFFLKYIIEFLIYFFNIIITHTIPKNISLPKNLVNKSSLHKSINVHNVWDNVKKTNDYFMEDEYKDCYNHFKKYFYTSLIVQTRFQALSYAMNKAISISDTEDLFLEFGVFNGKSINYTSNILKDKSIYGFDSFEGLREDWVATNSAKGRFNRYKKIPKLNSNVIPIVGWVQDTLPNFFKDKNNKEIIYAYLDVDTYPSTKFILEKIKPYLKDKCILIFDELYNYPGWRTGEYRALIEVFKEDEFKYLCFCEETFGAVVIQYNKKS